MQVSFHPTAFAAIILALGATYCGCASRSPVSADNESTLLAQDGTDANEVEAQASSLSASLTLASGSVTGDAGATMAGVATSSDMLANASNTGAFFLPAGCVVVTPDAANMRVTYAFTQCSGPWGLVRVSGTIIAKYSDPVSPSGLPQLQIDVGGDQPGSPAALRFNRGVASYHATSTVTGVVGKRFERSMHWTGDLDGTTARGRTFKRTADRTTTWTLGQSDVTHNGTAQGIVDGREIDTVVTNYVRQRGECPTSGVVTITNKAKAESVEIIFEGDNQAKFTGVDGKSYEIVLACGL